MTIYLFIFFFLGAPTGTSTQPPTPIKTAGATNKPAIADDGNKDDDGLITLNTRNLIIVGVIVVFIVAIFFMVCFYCIRDTSNHSSDDDSVWRLPANNVSSPKLVATSSPIHAITLGGNDSNGNWENPAMGLGYGANKNSKMNQMSSIHDISSPVMDPITQATLSSGMTSGIRPNNYNSYMSNNSSLRNPSLNRNDYNNTRRIIDNDEYKDEPEQSLTTKQYRTNNNSGVSGNATPRHYRDTIYSSNSDEYLSDPPESENRKGMSSPTPSYFYQVFKPHQVYRVLYDFQPSLPDEIEILAGQIIRTEETFEDGWAYGINMTTGKQGTFPLNCLEDDYTTDNDNETRSNYSSERSATMRSRRTSSLPSGHSQIIMNAQLQQQQKKNTSNNYYLSQINKTRM